MPSPRAKWCHEQGDTMSRNKFYSRLDVRRAMLAAAPFCAIFAAQNVHAVDHNPTDLATLRAALITVNGSSTNDRILLPAGTITLDAGALDNANLSGDLDITKALGTLEVIGAGQAATILDGGGFDRVFHVNTPGSVTISNLTVRNGLVSDNGTGTTQARGGGILHVGGGSLTLTNVTVSANEARGTDGAAGSASAPGDIGGLAEGGGVYLGGGAVTITGCTFAGNISRGGDGGDGGVGSSSTTAALAFGNKGGGGGTGGDGFGGAIMSLAAGTVTITGSSMSGNQAIGGIGGQGGRGGDALATGTSTNTVFAIAGSGGAGGTGGRGVGGAIFLETGTLDLSASCVNANAVTGGAGGTGGVGGDGSVTGSAFSSSFVAGGSGGTAGPGGEGFGGGLYIDAGSISVVNSTVSGNASTGGAGGTGGTGGDASGATSANPGSGGDGGDGAGGMGGGVFVTAGSATVNISNATVAFNTASGGAGGIGGAPGPGGTSGSSGSDGVASAGQGGGIFLGAATVTLTSTIVSDNVADTAVEVSGSLTADACLFESTTGATITPGVNGNLTGDPGLSALALNNGTTLSHLIAQTSIARNTGSNPLMLTTDQRGQNRDDGGGVDIGAVEFSPIDTSSGGASKKKSKDEGCSTGTNSSRLWLIAPLAALVALFRRRRARD